MKDKDLKLKPTEKELTKEDLKKVNGGLFGGNISKGFNGSK